MLLKKKNKKGSITDTEEDQFEVSDSFLKLLEELKKCFKLLIRFPME